MNIEVRLFASLSSYSDHPAISANGLMVLEPPATVRDVLSLLALPREKIKLVFLNGIREHVDASLNEGDRLGLFPPIGGG